MSLTTERLQTEYLINKLQGDKASLELSFDCHNTMLRMETSPMLKIEDVDIDKIKLLSDSMFDDISKIRAINTEIGR